jgi:hypothetical protein
MVGVQVERSWLGELGYEVRVGSQYRTLECVRRAPSLYETRLFILINLTTVQRSRGG